MNPSSTNMDKSGAADDRPRTLIHRIFRVGVILLSFIGLVFLFYAMENYRGERAWQKYKRSLMAQGQRFDLAAFNLPPVPDDQNFLKAPLIEDWFPFYGQAPGVFPSGRMITISRQGDYNLFGSWIEGRPTDLKEWRDYFRRNKSKSAGTNLNDAPMPTLSSEGRPVSNPGGPTDAAQVAEDESTNLVPMIMIDQTPLQDALHDLARQAGVGIIIDSSTFDLEDQGEALMQHPISIRFENVTAREALDVVLENHGLAMEETANHSVFQIIRALAPAPVWPNEAVDLDTVSLPPAADESVPIIKMDEIPALDAVRNLARYMGLNIQFDPQTSHQTYSASYSLQLWNATPRNALSRVLADLGLALKSIDDSIIFVVLPSHRVMPAHQDNSAVTILKSFDSFDSEFKALYAACQRPQSRMDTDVDRFVSRPSRVYNFVGFRQVSQALTLHASAELSLGNTSVAFQDITALYRLTHSLRGQPNLVPAMIQVALTGLYLQVVWEGLAANRWDDAQLQTLQQQLASFDLVQDSYIGLEGNQATLNGWLEHIPPHELAVQFVDEMTGYKAMGRPKPVWANPIHWAIRWGPRGWIRQTQIGYTERYQEHLVQLDFRHQRVFPLNRPSSSGSPNDPLDTLTPVSALVRKHGPNFVKAVEVTARHQNGIHQARVACALERYRQSHGAFPHHLAQLESSFIDRVPHDLMTGLPLEYRSTQDGQFVLYSLGWDGKDDAAGSADWVWRYPGRH